MKAVHLGPVPNDMAGKLDWCVRSIQALAEASTMDDPNRVADEFTVSNVSETRELDATVPALANLTDAQSEIEATRNVLLTFLLDLKRRGSKRQP